MNYHRLSLDERVFDEFEVIDEKHVDWQGFIAKLKELLSISYDLDEVLECIYRWMRYNGMFSLHEVFKTTEIDRETFEIGCKKAGTNLELPEIYRIFDYHSYTDKDQLILDYDKIERIYEEKKPQLIAKFKHTDNIDKATIFEAIRNILKIKGCTLRELFGLESMVSKDEISLYECTKVLVTELNTLGRDFTEGINKFVLNHLIPGSKSHISFKSLLDEYEEYYNIEKGTSETKYRENCILKMLNRISNKLIYREVDLKSLGIAEFSIDDIEKLIIRTLDIYNQQPPPKSEEEKEDREIKEKLGFALKKKPEEEEKKDENKDKKWVPHEITDKEKVTVRDTIDYIMNGMSFITLEALLELLRPYLQKQKHWMEILYRLKQHLKKRHCSLLESFQAYKSYERFKNTELRPEEFLKVLLSIKFDISEVSLYK